MTDAKRDYWRSGVPGSSPLPIAEQAWYLKRFGVRYLAVQDQPQRPSRRERRAKRKADLG